MAVEWIHQEPEFPPEVAELSAMLRSDLQKLQRDYGERIHRAVDRKEYNYALTLRHELEAAGAPIVQMLVRIEGPYYKPPLFIVSGEDLERLGRPTSPPERDR